MKRQLIRLDGLSPLKIMSRGYSLSYHDDKLIKSVEDVNIDDSITVKLTDGRIEAQVKNKEKKA